MGPVLTGRGGEWRPAPPDQTKEEGHQSISSPSHAPPGRVPIDGTQRTAPWREGSLTHCQQPEVCGLFLPRTERRPDRGQGLWREWVGWVGADRGMDGGTKDWVGDKRRVGWHWDGVGWYWNWKKWAPDKKEWEMEKKQRGGKGHKKTTDRLRLYSTPGNVFLFDVCTKRACLPFWLLVEQLSALPVTALVTCPSMNKAIHAICSGNWLFLKSMALLSS